jgi:hypothetical protein
MKRILAVLLLLLVAALAWAVDLTPNLVAYYRFDESSGNAADA